MQEIPAVYSLTNSLKRSSSENNILIVTQDKKTNATITEKTLLLTLPDNTKQEVALTASKKLADGGLSHVNKVEIAYNSIKKKLAEKIVASKTTEEYTVATNEIKILRLLGQLEGEIVDDKKTENTPIRKRDLLYTNNFKEIENDKQVERNFLEINKAKTTFHFFTKYLGKSINTFIINFENVATTKKIEFRLTYTQRLLVAYGLLESLAKIHKLGIIHGDISLNNLAIHIKALTPASLFDYNLSKIINEPHNVKGTPQPLTASPTVLQGGDITLKSDIYSARILLALLFNCTEINIDGFTHRDGRSYPTAVPLKSEDAFKALSKDFNMDQEQAKAFFSICANDNEMPENTWAEETLKLFQKTFKEDLKKLPVFKPLFALEIANEEIATLGKSLLNFIRYLERQRSHLCKDANVNKEKITFINNLLGKKITSDSTSKSNKNLYDLFKKIRQKTLQPFTDPKEACLFKNQIIGDFNETWEKTLSKNALSNIEFKEDDTDPIKQIGYVMNKERAKFNEYLTTVDQSNKPQEEHASLKLSYGQ